MAASPLCRSQPLNQDLHGVVNSLRVATYIHSRRYTHCLQKMHAKFDHVIA